MKIWCCGCQAEVDARLTSGAEIYPHRPDLSSKPLWKCDGCGSYVGTHHKTANPTKPLGCIPSSEMRNARIQIHALIDPMWQSKRIRRREIYERLGVALGRDYHTAELRTIEEARTVYRATKAIQKKLQTA